MYQTLSTVHVYVYLFCCYILWAILLTE